MATELPALLRSKNMKRADLARALDVDKSTVTRWCQKRMPAERAAEIEKLVGIPRNKLRPDIFEDAA